MPPLGWRKYCRHEQIRKECSWCYNTARRGAELDSFGKDHKNCNEQITYSYKGLKWELDSECWDKEESK